MLKFSTRILGGVAALSLAAAANGAVIINEAFVGGGSSTAGTAFTRDFVELYNTGPAPVDLTGWRVTYASASGNFGTNNVVAFAAGSFIAVGDHLLLVSGGAGSAGAPVPNANYYNGTTSGASLSGSAGSIKLFDSANVSIDTLGYGTTVTAADANGVPKIETAAAPAPTSGNTTSLSRSGFTDTNNNSVDFTNQPPSPTAGTMSAVVVPEPASLAIAGLAGLVLRRRRA